jgi:hypothetical protein
MSLQVTKSVSCRDFNKYFGLFFPLWYKKFLTLKTIYNPNNQSDLEKFVVTHQRKKQAMSCEPQIKKPRISDFKSTLGNEVIFTASTRDVA